MNFNLSKIQYQLKWRDWLHEPVYFEKRIVERYKAYRVFVITGLMPFVKKHGYSWVNEQEIPNHLANFIYQKKEWVFQEDARNEDYDYYIIRRITQDHWDAFWNRWGYFVDFSEENLRNRFKICMFVWNRLDLYSSAATDDLEWELGEDGPEDTVPLNDLTFVKDKHSLY
jgi:hypothetical protein